MFKGPQPLRGYFRKKFLHLMVPYFAWLLVFNLKAIAGVGFNLVQGDLSGEKLQFYLDHFGAQLYGGLEVHGVQMILWFPPCLFFTQQIANFIFARFSSIKVQVLLAAGCYALGYGNQYLAPDFHLPLAFNVVCGALPFFFLGHWLRESRDGFLVWGAACVSLLAIGAIFGVDAPLGHHMRMARYGIPLISTLAALGGFYCILNLSGCFDRINAASRVGRVVGDASMTIMYLHAVALTWQRSVGIVSPYVLCCVALLLPILMHYALGRVPLIGGCFVGSWASSKKSAPVVAVKV